MTTKKAAASYLPEVRARAVRLVLAGGGDHPTRWAAISSVSAKIGCTAETLRKASACFAMAELDRRSRT